MAAKATSSGAPLIVSSCASEKIAEIIAGTYHPSGSNHGKVVYRQERKPGRSVDVLIYFWDDRDGNELCGWWFGPSVGGDQVRLCCMLGSVEPLDGCLSHRVLCVVNLSVVEPNDAKSSTQQHSHKHATCLKYECTRRRTCTYQNAHLYRHTHTDREKHAEGVVFKDTMLSNASNNLDPVSLNDVQKSIDVALFRR